MQRSNLSQIRSEFGVRMDWQSISQSSSILCICVFLSVRMNLFVSVFDCYVEFHRKWFSKWYWCALAKPTAKSNPPPNSDLFPKKSTKIGLFLAILSHFLGATFIQIQLQRELDHVLRSSLHKCWFKTTWRQTWESDRRKKQWFLWHFRERFSVQIVRKKSTPCKIIDARFSRVKRISQKSQFYPSWENRASKTFIKSSCSGVLFSKSRLESTPKKTIESFLGIWVWLCWYRLYRCLDQFTRIQPSLNADRMPSI